jgi:hypothetical protein
MGRNKANLSSALLVAALVLPIEVVRHLIGGLLGILLVAAPSGFVVLAIALGTRHLRPWPAAFRYFQIFPLNNPPPPRPLSGAPPERARRRPAVHARELAPGAALKLRPAARP